MTTKSSGFSLIELLVVVAILGIIASIGVISYSGYIASAKKKSATNIMMQISLGQVEYYSDNGVYYGSNGTTCTPDGTSSTAIETNLLGGADSINEDMEYLMCTVKSGSDYTVVAQEDTTSADKCTMSMPKSTKITYNTHC